MRYAGGVLGRAYNCNGYGLRDGKTASYLAEGNVALFILQVKLLEGVILAINLIIAVLVGSCMLNNLGTPTRFETPKDTARPD